MAFDDATARRRLEEERNRLTTLRDGLRDGLSDETENASLEELSDSDQHAADTGTETFNRERDLSALESVEAELDDVERAFERLAAGDYGVCTACGRRISDERLEALPATPYCIEDAQLAAAEAAPGVAPLGGSGAGGGLEEPGRPI